MTKLLLTVPAGTTITYTLPTGRTITGTVVQSVGDARLGNSGFRIATTDGDVVHLSRYARVTV